MTGVATNDVLRSAVSFLQGPGARHRLEDIEVDEVSVVDRPANRRTFFVVKRLLAKQLASLAPSDDASDEELRELLRRRSEEVGIEVTDDAALRFPAEFPEDLELYGDPVNLKFPIDTAERTRNARVRFKQFATEIYDQEQSRAIVHERIVRREIELGIEPSFDPDDPLDALLPADLKADLTEDQTMSAKTKTTKDDPNQPGAGGGQPGSGGGEGGGQGGGGADVVLPTETKEQVLRALTAHLKDLVEVTETVKAAGEGQPAEGESGRLPEGVAEKIANAARGLDELLATVGNAPPAEKRLPELLGKVAEAAGKLEGEPGDDVRKAAKAAVDALRAVAKQEPGEDEPPAGGPASMLGTETADKLKAIAAFMERIAEAESPDAVAELTSTIKNAAGALRQIVEPPSPLEKAREDLEAALGIGKRAADNTVPKTPDGSSNVAPSGGTGSPPAHQPRQDKDDKSFQDVMKALEGIKGSVGELASRVEKMERDPAPPASSPGEQPGGGDDREARRNEIAERRKRLRTDRHPPRKWVS